MGTKCTLTCAKIFMAIFEETHIYQLIKQKGQLCLRYIDDNFSYGQFLETNYNNFISKINEVHTPLSWFLLLKKPDRKKKKTQKTHIHFLDIVITKTSTGKLLIILYKKRNRPTILYPLKITAPWNS